MVTLHVFWSILAGFAVIMLLAVMFTIGLRRLVPAWSGDQANPRPVYVLVSLIYAFVAAIAGGYVTARMAVRDPLSSVLALAIVVLVIGAVSILQTRDQQPIWFQISGLVVSALGVFAGGVLQLRLWELM